MYKSSSERFFYSLLSSRRCLEPQPEFHPTDCFKSFSPLSNDFTEGVIMTRSNRMKFRLLEQHSRHIFHFLSFSFIFFHFQFIQELFPELQNAELTVQGLKIPSQPKNSLRLPLGQKKKPTVCSKFNESLIKLVVAMKRYVKLVFYVRHQEMMSSFFRLVVLAVTKRL